jgi:hypothetical protein
MRQMQQTYGNRATQRSLQRAVTIQREMAKREEKPPEEEEEPSDVGAKAEVSTADYVQREISKREEKPPDEEEKPSDVGGKAEAMSSASTAATPNLAAAASSSVPSQSGVQTILRPGQSPELRVGTSSPSGDYDEPKYTKVAPGGAPGVDNNAAGNDCLPSTKNAVVDWDVVAKDANTWRANVKSLTLSGQVNIKPWPSQPNSMVVPNTPNPVDGGNINNTAGSDNQWEAVIADLADYNDTNGGAGLNWHSNAASTAHEWTHWNVDYIEDSVLGWAGGNWDGVNEKIDKLTEPKSSSADAGAAKTALQPKVDAEVSTWRSKTIKRWNIIPDTPGVVGSTGYEAGMKVLNGHIDAIRAYAISKGWAGAGTKVKKALAPVGHAATNVYNAVGGSAKRVWNAIF